MVAAGTAELVVVVAPLVPLLDAGVDSVEEVEGYTTVCSAEPTVLHGAPANSEPDQLLLGGRWKKRGSGGGERGRREREN